MIIICNRWIKSRLYHFYLRAIFQDAHEFLIFLINHINEIIVGEQGSGQSQSANNSKSKSTSVEPEAENAPTWINEIFQVWKKNHTNTFCSARTVQGILTSETRCLNCETVTSKDEEFCDLSIDVDQNTSVTNCLRNFSSTETLCSDNKFKCDTCCSYQVLLTIKRKDLIWCDFIYFRRLIREWEWRGCQQYLHFIWRDSSMWSSITDI